MHGDSMQTVSYCLSVVIMHNLVLTGLKQISCWWGSQPAWLVLYEILPRTCTFTLFETAALFCFYLYLFSFRIWKIISLYLLQFIYHLRNYSRANAKSISVAKLKRIIIFSRLTYTIPMTSWRTSFFYSWK